MVSPAVYDDITDPGSVYPRRPARLDPVLQVALGLGLIVGFTLFLLWAATPAYAGCGCEKAPPDLAEIRPGATYAGQSVALFSNQLINGQTYTVTFTNGVNGNFATVNTQAVNRRDLADGVYRVQLVTPVPSGLPLGPTAVAVSNASGVVLALTDDALTIVPAPIAIPSAVGSYTIAGYKAAVGRDGTVYVSLDMAGVTQPRVIKAQAKGYALRFTSADVAFYNTQGFLMQLLDERMPGLFSIGAANSSNDSDVLQYSRHEFNTFFLQHEERQVHGVGADPNWHVDGTRHIDHNRLILAIAAVRNDGTPPPAGATPAFNLELESRTLFHDGIIGKTSATLSGFARTDSYSSNGGGSATSGDVRSNGTIVASGYARIEGNATGLSVSTGLFSTVTGTIVQNAAPIQIMPVDIPDHLDNLGALVVTGNVTLGPGSYRYSSLSISGYGRLHIDNTAGPVTLYVTGSVSVSGFGDITTAANDPEKFAVYVANPSLVQIATYAHVNGLVYAPTSLVQVANFGQISGSVVGNIVDVSGYGKLHYDTALRGQ